MRLNEEVFGVVVLDDPTEYLDVSEHRIFHNCGGQVSLSKVGVVNRFHCQECRFRLSVSEEIGDMIRRMIAYVARTGEVVIKDTVDLDGDGFKLHVAPIIPEDGELVEPFKEFLKTYKRF